MADPARRSYDAGASQQVQGDIGSIASRLENLIDERDRAVRQAMADFTADGVSDDYITVERRWNTAASEVKHIITLVRDTLNKNDDTAATTLSQARAAVADIG
jgi:hypothetical protein